MAVASAAGSAAPEGRQTAAEAAAGPPEKAHRTRPRSSSAPTTVVPTPARRLLRERIHQRRPTRAGAGRAAGPPRPRRIELSRRCRRRCAMKTPLEEWGRRCAGAGEPPQQRGRGRSTRPRPPAPTPSLLARPSASPTTPLPPRVARRALQPRPHSFPVQQAGSTGVRGRPRRASPARGGRRAVARGRARLLRCAACSGWARSNHNRRSPHPGAAAALTESRGRRPVVNLSQPTDCGFRNGSVFPSFRLAGRRKSICVWVEGRRHRRVAFRLRQSGPAETGCDQKGSRHNMHAPAADHSRQMGLEPST